MIIYFEIDLDTQKFSNYKKLDSKSNYLYHDINYICESYYSVEIDSDEYIELTEDKNYFNEDIYYKKLLHKGFKKAFKFLMRQENLKRINNES